MTETPLLEVADFSVSFVGDRGRTTSALTGITLSARRGSTLGIVGESGSGKSVTALSIMRLLPSDTARVSGAIRFEGRDLLTLSGHQMQDLRGNRLAMIFQEPMTSLNPSYTVGDQVVEVLRRHRGMSASAARSETIALFKRVRIPLAEMRVDEYPHKLSGGMRQRVLIAMALACRPALLIADEPTTALDVTIQAQILELLRQLKDETDTAIILITHDLGVIAEMCDEVAVMYAGEIVERATTTALFTAPQHPYTVGLIASVPRLTTERRRLSAIPGSVPILSEALTGCRFAARCPFAEARCRTEPQQLFDTGNHHLSRCWKAPLERLVA